MEVKVLVDGIPRVVCGVNQETTCQEVVLVLAQAQGQPGRYILRERFKEFERCMAPGERLLESLGKYGELAREVQLTLQKNVTSTWDEAGRRVGKYQVCPPLRRREAAGKLEGGSSSNSSSSGGLATLHRQSLPSCFRQEAEQKESDPKKSKRKSLTLVEEARGWLESLGKGRHYSTAGEKESKRTGRKNRSSLDVFLSTRKDIPAQRRWGKQEQRGVKADGEPQISTCAAYQSRERDGKFCEDSSKAKHDPRRQSISDKEEKDALRETIVCQLMHLQDLQAKVTRTDGQIFELEEKLKSEESKGKLMEEQLEQIKFWENELKAEQSRERDLQRQFLELKAKVAECKVRLEDFRRDVKNLDSFVASDPVQKPASSPPKDRLLKTEPEVCRKSPSAEGTGATHQTRERRLTGPTELQEWWTRWSESQSVQAEAKEKVVHRSELTIYLGAARV